MSSLTVTVVSQTATQLKLSWSPPPGALGYVFYRDGKRISNTWDPARSSISFAIPDANQHSYQVQAIGETSSGTVTVNGPSPPPPTTSRAGVGTSRQGGDYDSSYASGYSKLDVMMIDIADPYDKIAAALPNTRVLFYRSLMSCNRGYDSSIPHATAAANNWLAKDSSGNIIIAKDFPTNDILDFSNPAVSTALGNACVQWCRDNGFKGVWMDDGQANQSQITNAMPAGWTEASWYSYMVSHMRRTAKIVRDAGYEFVCNANGRFAPGSGHPDDGGDAQVFWKSLVTADAGSERKPSGLTSEFWMQSPIDFSVLRRTGGATWHDFWDGWHALHQLVNAAGVDFMPMTYSATDDAPIIYARSSFLLDYTGGTSAMLILQSSGSPYGPTWCKNMGAAKGAAVNNNGVWTRQFANGSVRVDTVNGTATIS